MLFWLLLPFQITTLEILQYITSHQSNIVFADKKHSELTDRKDFELLCKKNYSLSFKFQPNRQFHTCTLHSVLLFHQFVGQFIYFIHFLCKSVLSTLYCVNLD